MKKKKKKRKKKNIHLMIKKIVTVTFGKVVSYGNSKSSILKFKLGLKIQYENPCLKKNGT